MNLQLIQGQFNAQEAIDIVTQLVKVKIKFQESKIAATDSEEVIKMREGRIKELQKDLQQARAEILKNGDFVSLESTIRFNDGLHTSVSELV